jgi:hypothetical protein
VTAPGLPSWRSQVRGEGRPPHATETPAQLLQRARRAVALVSDANRAEALAGQVRQLLPLINAGQLFKCDAIDALIETAVSRGMGQFEAERIVGNEFLAAKNEIAPARSGAGAIPSDQVAGIHCPRSGLRMYTQ